MRKRANLLRSHRSRPSSTSLSDLVTASERTISSQASAGTQASRRWGASSQEWSSGGGSAEELEEIMGEEIDTLFITAEEERKIQNILEFARKGKINPGNAFEIPVRVIDPQLTDNSNMRFWKFASELLLASMSVYDKRVENTFHTTHRMFDALLRVQGHAQTHNDPEDDAEERSRRQRGELIQVEVGDLARADTLTTYDFAALNCEEPERINIKNLRNQFLPDPLFYKRLQAFDSNSLKSLFLNAFESNNDLQVSFFNCDRIAPHQKQEHKQQDKQEEAEKEEELEERMPRFIAIDEKLSTALSSVGVFSEMSSFRKENVRGTLESNRFEVADFAEELRALQADPDKATNQNTLFNPNSLNDSEATETNSIYSFQADNNNDFNFQFTASDHTQLSDDPHTHPHSQPHSQANSLPNTFPYSHDHTLSEFYIEEADEQSDLTPWELEFRGLTLQRRVRRNPEGGRKRGPRVPATDQQINFLDGKQEVRSRVFTHIRTPLANIKDDYQDRNLLPLSMHPFTEAFKRRKLHARADSFELNRQTVPSLVQANSYQQPENQPEEAADEPTLDSYPRMEVEGVGDVESGGETNLESQVVRMEHESQGVMYRSTGIRNIREIKEKIYEKIQAGRRVRLSELNINISPSSILIVFLHLVNENNCAIHSLDAEHDLEISPSPAD